MAVGGTTRRLGEIEAGLAVGGWRILDRLDRQRISAREVENGPPEGWVVPFGVGMQAHAASATPIDRLQVAGESQPAVRAEGGVE